jgi:phosphate:Na+ symporter
VFELIALYLAGLSFFFTGVAGISDNLRQMSGQRFRRLLARFTQQPLMGGLVGAMLGAVTQSASVVAFILSGMITSGLLPLRQALIVLACSNIGTAVLVFIAALDLHLPILYLIGISGLLLSFKLAKKPAIAGLLSLGLIFFGLEMMKQAFSPVASSPGFAVISQFFARWPYSAFFFGAALRSFIHSSSAVAAIAITINKGGQLGEFPAMLVVAGLGLGTAVATYMLSSNLRGAPRQIAIYQALTNVFAGFLIAALLVLERLAGVPLLIAALHRLSSSISGRMAGMYLAYNITITGTAILGLRWAPEWLARLCPPTPEQDLSRPMYLRDGALNSPETALDLVALEQMRLMRSLESYLDAARPGGRVRLKPLHAAAVNLGGEIEHFLGALVKLPIATDIAARAISFQRKEETLRALEENVFLFAETLEGRSNNALTGQLIEGLDTILLRAVEALQSQDALDIDMLVSMTDDRGGMMEKLRHDHRLDNPQDAGDVSALHYATTLFERNIWLLRQLALWMHEDVRLSST